MLFYKGWYVSRRLQWEVVCTNIHNNVLLGSSHGAPIYRPAVRNCVWHSV
ncbi:hypothetical protein E2C01_064379 [Portunus trituberculatus]|uniref:Uncharacterized protein n=1 Tax=Portunus trituberculatus TaxID=210409 RepID=A0A5B7HCV2_PORTR|nr:hypothetical protein [Portunus trituberculatus]